jgi:uncharacterized cupin superfamily protein
VELVEVSLPPNVRVPYPASAFAFQQQQIWILTGELEFVEGEVVHHLAKGDCLLLGPPADCVFFNAVNEPAHYLITLTRR